MNRGVRRWCATLLLGVYGLVLGMPLLAMGRGLESRLPACCRRAGMHHCAMNPMMGSGEGSTGRRWVGAVERCPMYPVPVEGPRGVGFDAVLGVQAGFAAPVCRSASAVQAGVRGRVARERSRHTRGPPVGMLA